METRHAPFDCYSSGSLQWSQVWACVCVWKVEDVRYLVEMVWASRSVLHGSGDLYDLVLVRWDRWREWSPWNCILLSKNEAKAHTELENINKVSMTAGVPARLVLM